MNSLPWTKFQDFYLRFGFLKLLVHVLSGERASMSVDTVLRRLNMPMFDAVTSHAELWERVRPTMSWYPRRARGGKTIDSPEVAEALLIDRQHQSFLYGITRDTAYKILDWGHNVALVGRGNQLTERGILLRLLSSTQSAESFLAGDIRAWNPFELDVRERLFLLFHLYEIDRVTVRLIELLGKRAGEHSLESMDAARLTCEALFHVLDSMHGNVQPRDIPAFRTARELACTIAEEVGVTDRAADCVDVRARRLPRPPKLNARRSVLLGSSARTRKTTKNADHQTIPRFEQLVDLGFLTKLPHGTSTAEDRRRWRYFPTAACRRWLDAGDSSKARRFEWDGFGASAVRLEHGQAGRLGSIEDHALYFWNSYQLVHRHVGHTPLDSVALIAMISAAADGIVVEMLDIHRLLLRIKRKNAMPAHVFFASGNDLDKMFVQVKRGFLDRFAETKEHLVQDESE